MEKMRLWIYTIVAIVFVYGMPKSFIYLVHANGVAGVDQNICTQIKTFENGPGQQPSGRAIKLLSSRWTVPAYFVKNAGQLDKQYILYYAKKQDCEVGFADGYVYFNVAGLPNDEESMHSEEKTAEYPGRVVFSMKVGDGTVQPVSKRTSQGYSNYIIGSNVGSWYTRVSHFEQIWYREVYPGIDLVFFFNDENQLTYEYRVSPGADPTPILISYFNIEGIKHRQDGGMDILTAGGTMIDHALLCYQNIDGVRRVVSSSFQLTDSNSYAVELLENYDRSCQLVVDPTLAFSSYWGSGEANNRTVVVDEQGNVYMSGGTSGTAWPTTPGAYQTTHKGKRLFGLFGKTWADVAIVKFDPNGKVIWSTFIGGPYEDYAYVSAVNQNGELYISGRAGEGFPTTPGAFDRTFNGGSFQGKMHAPTDAFVVKLSANGDRLLYSTYIGGSGNDNGRAIHLLPSGELLVGGGNSTSPDFPTTPEVLKPNRGGVKDSWIAKVTADGGDLKFSTYFGSNNETMLEDETIRALGVDLDGNIWIGGTTSGSDLIPTPDAFQTVHGGGKSESYIAKISSDGEKLVYFSWLGGKYREEIETEGVSDQAGNFYVAGSTTSSDFPFSPGAFQSTVKGLDDMWGGDGYVVKVNNNGSMGFATAYGGSTPGPEALFGPVVDRNGNVYVTGRFRSPDCPLTPDAFQPEFAGKQDAVLVVFSPDGTQLLYGSYFGGSGTDHGRHIEIHPDGSAVYIIGETGSTDIPLVKALQTTPAGVFLAKFKVGE